MDNITTNPLPNASCANRESEKRDWLMTRILLPLENSCRQNYTERQIDFWCEWFSANLWTRLEILSAHMSLLRECKFLPSAADWTRVRPAKQDYVIPLDEPFESTTKWMAARAPTSWAKFMLEATTKGLESHDMKTAYDVIIAEGERRGIDIREIHQFKQARLDMVTMHRDKAEHCAARIANNTRRCQERTASERRR